MRRPCQNILPMYADAYVGFHVTVNKRHIWSGKFYKYYGEFEKYILIGAISIALASNV